MKMAVAVAALIASLATLADDSPGASSGGAERSVDVPGGSRLVLPAQAFEVCTHKAIGAACSVHDGERSIQGICAKSSTASLFCFQAPDRGTRPAPARASAP